MSQCETQAGAIGLLLWARATTTPLRLSSSLDGIDNIAWRDSGMRLHRVSLFMTVLVLLACGCSSGSDVQPTLSQLSSRSQAVAEKPKEMAHPSTRGAHKPPIPQPYTPPVTIPAAEHRCPLQTDTLPPKAPKEPADPAGASISDPSPQSIGNQQKFLAAVEANRERLEKLPQEEREREYDQLKREMLGD